MIADAVVIGAGPAGSSTAALLARAGWSVVLVERRSFPRAKVCGEFVSAPTLALLDEIGIRAQFDALAGPPIRELGVCCGEREVLAPMPAGTGRALRRQHFDVLLLQAARRAGACVLEPCEVLQLARDGTRFQCTVQRRGEAPRDLEARMVVAANGSWERSTLPFAATGMDPAPSDLLAFKAHFTGGAQAARRMSLLAFPGGYGGLVQADDGHLVLSCCVRRDVLEECRRRAPGERAGDAVLGHVLRHVRGASDALRDARCQGGWLAAGPVRPGMRARYRDGVFAVGNAAGEAHPVIAEGISMAIQGAWLLVREVDRARGEILAGRSDGAGSAYAQAWRQHFLGRIRTAALVAGLAMRPAAAAPLLRAFGAMPALLTHSARLSGKGASCC